MNLNNVFEIALTVLAVVLATYAVISFTSIQLLSSPITVSSLILLIALSAHFLLARTEDSTLVYTGYTILCLYGISVAIYLMTTFSVGPLLRSVILLSLSAVILAGVYSIRRDLQVLSQRNLSLLVLGTLLLSAGLIGLDIFSDGPTDTIVPVDDITTTDNGQELVIAHIKAENPSVLPKSYDSNSYVACVSEDIFAGEEEARSKNIGFASIADDVIVESVSKEMKIPSRALAKPGSVNNITVIRTEKCPANMSTNTIAVYQNN